jgi:hypothetical protein
MTLKQLLQQNKSREQVDFNLSLPSVTSRELQAGQYSVAVQRTPKAEQTTLGRLADALGKVNPIIAKYGDAQIAENERQILDVQQQIASMDPAEKERMLARPEAEVNLSKAFRDDYELNPVATYRAKMLLGAEKNVEFNAVLTERIEEFKTKFLREEGDKPSYSQISEAINEITQDYLKSSGLNSEDKGIMRTGFLQEASVNINKLKQTLPSAMAEEHKQEVLMPNLASSLARTYKPQDGTDLVRLKSQWDNFSSSLSRSEQIKVIDSALGILNFDSGTKELNDGIAFLEDMRDAGVTIGNQAIDSASGSPLGESFYSTKIDELKEMALTVRNKEKAEALSRANDYEMSMKKRFAKAADDDNYSSEEPYVLDILEKEEAYIKSLDVSDFEEAEMLKGLGRAYVNGFKELNDDIDEMESAADSGKSGVSVSEVKGDFRSTLVKTVLNELEAGTFKGVDVKEALIVAGGDEKAIDSYKDVDYDIIGLGPELRRIENKYLQLYKDKRSYAIDKIARLKPGEELTLPDSTESFSIGENDNIKNKRNAILAEYMTSLTAGIINDSKVELLDTIKKEKEDKAAEQKEQKEETARVQKEKEEREARTVKTKDSIAKSSEMISVAGDNTFSFKRLIGTAFKEQAVSIAPFNVFRAYEKTPFKMSDLYDAVEHTIKYNPNSPEDMQVIIDDISEIYTEAVPTIRRNLAKTKELQRKRFNPNDAVGQRFAKERMKITDNVLRARRLFQGYTYDEVIKAVSNGEGEPGYLSEGVVLRNPKEFFRFEFSGLGAPGPYQPIVLEYKAKAMLKDATDEQIVELAGILGLEPERIKGSQKRRSDYILNKKPKKAKEPEVKPKVKPKVTPEVKPEVTPKARPPIRTTAELKKEREEQLELNLDEPIKTDPTVEAKVTGTEGDITVYSPQRGGDKMEGGYPSSRPGPDGKALVRTVQDYANGTSEYITLAGSPSFYNKSYIIPELPYEDPKTGATKTLRNVRAVVHDTGGAFKTKPEFRYDIPYGRDLTNKQMTRYNGILKKKGIQFIDAVEPRVSEPLAADDPLSDDGAFEGKGLLP